MTFASGEQRSRQPEPTRRTWSGHRRGPFGWFYGVAAACAVIAVATFVARFSGSGGNIIWTAQFAIVAGLLGALGMMTIGTRLVADAGGLQLVRPFTRTKTYAWDDIAEIRPSIAKSRHTHLVLVPRTGPVVDLPVTEQHLDELRERLAATAGRDGDDGPRSSTG